MCDVRRSVANNLNDIAKDHPGVVLEVANRWIGENVNTDWLVKHACRTLLKQGDVAALTLFGFKKPKHVGVENFVVQSKVKMGERLSFGFSLQTQKKKLGKLRVEYAIDFMKKNGKQARKVFSVSESQVDTCKKTVDKNHSFKAISTRKYYSGPHSLAIVVNGQVMCEKNFELI